MRRRIFRLALLSLLTAIGLGSVQALLQAGPQTPARRPPLGAATPPFKTPLTLDQMKNKQAVLETSAGIIVIQLLPEAAPNHVGYFMKLAKEGTYNGTT